MSCEEIESEVNAIDDRIRDLVPQTDKTGKNVALGITGFFFIVPWFFMDLSSAEKEEIEAYKDRLAVLQRLAAKKQCKFAE